MDKQTTPTTPPAAPPPGTQTTAPATPPASIVTQALEKKPDTETKVDEKKVDPKTEAKADETKPADAKSTETKPAPIEVKLPDGFEVDAGALDKFKATAGELGLDAPKAQKLFDQYVELETARTAAADKALEAQEAKWMADVKADPELGGEKLPTTINEVRAAVTFMGRGFGDLVAKSGIGSHPDVVKALAKIGRALKDDTVANTATPASQTGERLSDAEVLYGKPTTDPSKKEQ